MTPNDPNEPLPTTPIGSGPAGPAPVGPTQWGAPPASPPAWGGGGGWGPMPPSMPPPPPARRDRLAVAIVAFIFGGLFLVFFGFLFLAYSVVKGESPALATGPRVAIIEVKGAIGTGAGGADADRILKQLRKVSQDDGLKAVVVRIDSPGGAVAPSQEIHDEVKKLAQKKTVVCSMGNLAASGGFYIAVACPKVVAEPGTLTGSIGVITQFPKVKGLLDRWDVKMETVKSGTLKDAGNPFAEMTAEERTYWQSLIDRVYSQFVRAVAQGRGLEEAAVRRIADGRVITGEEAKELKLVDALGNFYDAVELAKSEAKLSGEPHLVYPADERGLFLEQLMGSVAGAAADAVAARIQRGASAAQDPGVYFLAR
jgi:protease-4